MRKKFLLNGLFLVAALGLAYYASLPAGKNETGTQDWITIDEASLAEIKYLAADRTVSAKPLPGADRSGWWIQSQKTPKIPPPTADAAAKAPAETVDVGFKADASIKDLLKSFQPLSALRVLGDSDKLNLKEFGMVDSPDHLVFTTKDGKTIEFIVGKKSYGSTNPFLLDTARKKVILVHGTYIENLKNAVERMQERSIANFRFDEVKKLAIQRNGVKWQWDHSKKDSKGNLVWRDDKEGAEPKPSYATWLDKIFRLRVIRYASQAEKVAIDASRPLLSLECGDGVKPIETLVIYKGSGADGQPQYWLKTGFLDSYVDVGSPRVEALLKELDAWGGK